jgi:hypothetical protein
MRSASRSIPTSTARSVHVPISASAAASRPRLEEGSTQVAGSQSPSSSHHRARSIRGR